MIDPTRPCVEEQYASASNCSNLRVETDANRRSNADVLMAVSWGASRLGAAILRLHTEWDAAAKPIKPTKEMIAALASTILREDGKPDHVAAYARANDWYVGELRTLVGKLLSMPDVRREVALQAAKWGMDDAHNKAATTIRYWLDQTCHVCDGRKWRLVPGAPALSNKMCSACQGSGIGATPCGQDGRRLANFMDNCVRASRGEIKKRLRRLQNMQ